MTKKIIVPTDFSTNALIAAQYAIGLASKVGAEILLLHAYVAFHSPFQSELANQTDEQRARIGAEKGMKAFLESLKDGGGQSGVGAVVMKAELVEAVKANIVEHAADLVVMGTHGAAGLKKGLLGSNTYDVAMQVDNPLIIVPPDSVAVPDFSHVAFFTDYQDADAATLKGLISLTGNLVKRCTLVHIHEGMAAPSADERERLEQWKIRLEAVSDSIPLATELVHHREDLEFVTQTIDRLDASMVALSLKGGRSFFERLTHKSLAKEIIHQPAIPVLLLGGH